MVMQYFIPTRRRKTAENEVRRRLARDNKGKPKYKRYELKSLRRKKSIFKGGRTFFIAKIRKEK